ncbi:MAG: MSCRAMM family protein [Blastocatellia bacterium]
MTNFDREAFGVRGVDPALVFASKRFAIMLCLLSFLPVQSKTASIAGVVTLKGAPVRNVAVTLTPIESDGSWDQSQVRRTRTDGGGRFQFKALKAGNYVVAAMTPGYLIPSSDNVVHRGRPVTVAEGESLDDLAFEIVRGAVITGRVIDAGGEPVAEEPITLWRLNDQGTPGIFEMIGMPNARATDDRGVYRFYGLPAGRYQVSVGQVGREGIIVTMPNRRTFYPTTFHPDATNASQAKIVEVSEGDEAAGIDINIGRLRKTQDVFGRVLDAGTGQPMAGKGVAYLRFTGDPPRMSGYAGKAEHTDAQGAFHLPNLLPGKYSIHVSRTREDEHYSEPVEVEVGDEMVTGIEVRMRRGASVSGVMVIEGANDADLQREITLMSLHFFPVSPPRSAPVSGEAIRPGADGRFTAKGLEPGSHRIWVGGPSSLRASLLRVERDSGSHPDEITLQPGEQATDLRVVIAYGNATIRGQLKLTGGSLPDGVGLLVGARRVGTNRVANPWAMVDPSGKFSIRDLVPGEYDLIPWLRSDDPRQLAQLAERLSKIKVRVSVEANRESQVTIPVDLGRKEGEQ